MATKDQIVTAGLIGFIIIAVVAASILYFAARFSSYGNVKSVGCQVYADAAFTQPLEAINWGTIDAGSYSVANIWVRNNGTAPVTLTLSTANYNPAVAAQHLTLSWNYQNQTIQPSGSMLISLQLAVSSQVQNVGSFSFDIIVTASG